MWKGSGKEVEEESTIRERKLWGWYLEVREGRGGRGGRRAVGRGRLEVIIGFEGVEINFWV